MFRYELLDEKKALFLLLIGGLLEAYPQRYSQDLLLATHCHCELAGSFSFHIWVGGWLWTLEMHLNQRMI